MSRWQQGWSHSQSDCGSRWRWSFTHAEWNLRALSRCADTPWQMLLSPRATGQIWIELTGLWAAVVWPEAARLVWSLGVICQWKFTLLSALWCRFFLSVLSGVVIVLLSRMILSCGPRAPISGVPGGQSLVREPSFCSLRLGEGGSGVVVLKRATEPHPSLR